MLRNLLTFSAGSLLCERIRRGETFRLPPLLARRCFERIRTDTRENFSHREGLSRSIFTARLVEKNYWIREENRRSYSADPKSFPVVMSSAAGYFGKKRHSSKRLLTSPSLAVRWALPAAVRRALQPAVWARKNCARFIAGIDPDGWVVSDETSKNFHRKFAKMLSNFYKFS